MGNRYSVVVGVVVVHARVGVGGFWMSYGPEGRSASVRGLRRMERLDTDHVRLATVETVCNKVTMSSGPPSRSQMHC